MRRLPHRQTSAPRATFPMLVIAFALALTGDAMAQRRPGGRGPGDTVPPDRRGGGTYRGPGDTTQPGRPRVKRRPPRGATPKPEENEIGQGVGMVIASAPQLCTGLQFDVAPDFATWQHWWRHNAQGYLDLKARLHTTNPESGSDTFFLGQGDKLASWDALVPSEGQKREEVVPALLEILGSPQSPTLHREALLALARVAGSTAGESDIDRPTPYALVIESFLDDGNQLLVEAAAVGLGILGDDSSVATLSALVEDNDQGRSAVGKQWVPLRVRACAAYGLGLVGARTGNDEVREDIARQLMTVLNSPHFATRDLKVAAMTALGMTPLDWAPDPVSAMAGSARPTGLTRETQVEFLLDYFDPARERENRTRRHWLVRAHAATALARLVAGAPNVTRDRAAELLVDALRPRSSEPDEVRQSCVLALGMIGDADTGAGSMDGRIRATLVRTVAEGDPQSRRFALLALAQSAARPGQDGKPYAGLDPAQKELLDQLAHGRTQLKPWAALALGVMGNALQANEQPVDDRVLAALRKSCADNRRPAEAGAHMLALGLLRDTESVDALTSKLDFFAGTDGPRGAAAVAIGLTRNPGGVDALQAALENATFRPALAESLGIGLRLCGDQRVVPELSRELRKATGFGSQAPIVRALGQVGDSRSIPDLVATLGDEETTDWTRALVAAALGSICDKDPLPWTYAISNGINYRATTATLTTQEGLGVLDYL